MKIKRFNIIVLTIVFISLTAMLRAQSMMNSYLGLNINDNSFVFNMGTCAACSPAGANLLYYYTGGYATSHMVVKVNNTAYDLENLSSCPVVPGSLQNGGTYITGTKKVANLVTVNVLWEFDNNPAIGYPADTVKVKFTLTNISISTVNVALRLELDTMVINNDGTNISIDNGFSVIMQDTAWYKSPGQIPPNWWDFDVDPTVGTPSLVGRGYTYNNIYGEPATEPDIMEVANWVDVSSTAQWSVAPAGKSMVSYNDSAVVLWWCNGNQAANGFALNPNNSITFITYYGINREQMLTSPTVTRTISPSYTPTRTFTITGTFTPTNTPTLTSTATHSLTATSTDTPTITSTATPTFSVTGTLTDTPFFTHTNSPTITQTHTFTPSRTITGTSTPTFTITATASVTTSFTNTMTFTISPTFTSTMTITQTPTVTPTKMAFCFEVLGVFPNPFNTETKIVYRICKDADITAVIYAVSGEIVRKLHQQAAHGWNSLCWDGKNNSGKGAANGVFIYSIEAMSGEDRQTLWGKVAVLK